ncbi:hypothetical protein [Micromonospora sp. NPDC049282]|uniref:hypothetical protein n=1 Tax=Micromonospora sp. NPDC049282 TaxID=3364269 RepID=UPI00370F8C5D
MTVSVGKSWSIGRVHATSDYTVNGNGYSFRSCSWTGTNHTYRYRCTSATAGTWKINLVAREENGNGVRVQQDVRCDGYERNVYWTGQTSSKWPVHFHLWAPAGTGCRDSGCEQYLNNWYAVVA